MKFKNSSLKNKIWLYLVVFSIMILSFLWFFQIIFLGKYYEISKKSEINKIASKIKNSYGETSFLDTIDKLAFVSNVCIEISTDNLQNYSINYYDRGCAGITNHLEAYKLKLKFIDSSKKEDSYIFENKNNRTLVKALKLDDDLYIFINTSLVPVSSTTNILANQLVYVTFIVLGLSLIIGYFISKRISKPIIKLNKTALEMGKGNYDISFKTGDTIQEIEELATTLNNVSDELSKTDNLRRELLANVSHDLKTPLTMIKAYAEMVRDLSFNNKEKRNSNLNTIIDETDRLALLVDDILELSKMQSNVIDLNYKTFDLNDLIKNIVNKFAYLVDTDDYQFIYDNDKKIMINADRKKIEQVVYNLIGNAINHVGEDKKIIIEIENKKNSYVVKVIDHGKGIDAEELPLIWDKYYKANKQYKRDNNGTGLGLSIVKNIFVLHHFEYGVLSKKDEGTTFYFEFPKIV